MNIDKICTYVISYSQKGKSERKSTLEAAGSSEMLILIYQTILNRIPENCGLDFNCHASITTIM
jgi:hypothetical protein